MRNNIIVISSLIVLVLFCIYLIKNFNTFMKHIFDLSKKKYLKILFYMLVFVICVYYLYRIMININNSLDYYKNVKDNLVMFNECDNLVLEETKYYNSIINTQFYAQTSNIPYIPNDFYHIEGEWNSGFVIEDNNKNQFVWIPCTNLDNNEIPKLEKRYFSSSPELISKDYCYDIEYKNFLNSALEYGGFYISRYEIGNENEIPVSKLNAKIWNNITQNEAIKIAKNMYNNDEIKSELINGYAYDTVIDWVKKTNNIEIYNIENDCIYYSGRNKPYNNIYDLIDNILELSCEKNYETCIARGFYKKNAFNNYSFIDENTNRYSLLQDEREDYVGFRVILYK